jgi:uncharacterized protein YprB with RNaseH-like and TPR domain
MDLHNAAQVVKKFHDEHGRAPTRAEFLAMGFSCYSTRKLGFNKIIAAAGLETYHKKKIEYTPASLAKPPKILFLDIETAPILARVWGLWDQNVGLNQIVKDWFIMSFAAELAGSMHYLDQRYSQPLDDDSMMLVAIHHLLCEADIVVGHNVAKFDIRKLNARFLKHGMTPPTSYRVIDTLKIAKRHFALTSNKLEYVAKYLGCSEKLTNRKFNGQELWNQCLAGNKDAWDEMESYNKNDVVVLKEVYDKLLRWDNSISFGVFEHETVCGCGHQGFRQAGVKVTNGGKFERLVCESCGKEHIGRANLVHPDTRKELLR